MSVALSPLRRVGYWAARPRGGMESLGAQLIDLVAQHLSGEPRAEDFVDPSWSPDERRRIVRYLQDGERVEAYMGHSSCRLCGRDNGCLDLSDGIWVWPDGLVHYVRDHLVKPPQEFVDHALARGAR